MRLNLIPQPQEISLFEGSFLIRPEGTIFAEEDWILNAKDITTVKAFSQWHFTRENAEISFIKDMRLGEQEYIIIVNCDGIIVEASSKAGLFYAIQTLKQLAQYSKIACMKIHDFPSFQRRGLMLDISRGKLPKVSEIKKLVDMISALKYNELQLYVDNIVLDYCFLPNQWQTKDYYSSSDIYEIKEYCKTKFVDLVPNQNCLGHMEHWLDRRELAPLAVNPDGYMLGEVRKRPATINPSNPGTYKFLERLMDSILFQFDSSYVNIGCDEPMELTDVEGENAKAQSRLKVVEHINRMHNICKSHCKTLMIWDDVILGHPESGVLQIDENVIRRLPADTIFLDWGYEDDHPFDSRLNTIKGAGYSFYVCPGTSSWDSYVGRNGNAYKNIQSACENGFKHGAQGILLTDWGDDGHPQFPVISYFQYIHCGDKSWNCNGSSAKEDIFAYLDRYIYGDLSNKAAEIIYATGNAYKLEPYKMFNTSVLYRVLNDKLGYMGNMKGQTTEHFANILEYLENARKQITCIDMDKTIKDEFIFNCRLAETICRLGRIKLKFNASEALELCNEIESLIPEFEDLWNIRNHKDGVEIFINVLKERMNELKTVEN